MQRKTQMNANRCKLSQSSNMGKKKQNKECNFLPKNHTNAQVKKKSKQAKQKNRVCGLHSAPPLRRPATAGAATSPAGWRNRARAAGPSANAAVAAAPTVSIGRRRALRRGGGTHCSIATEPAAGTPIQ